MSADIEKLAGEKNKVGVEVLVCKRKRKTKTCSHPQCLSIAKGNVTCVKHGYREKCAWCMDAPTELCAVSSFPNLEMQHDDKEG